MDCFGFRRPGSNEIIISVGANSLISGKEIDRAWEDAKDCKVFVSQLEVSRALLQTPLEATLALFHRVRECCPVGTAGTYVIFNPAPAQTDLPNKVFALSDIVCPNETEAALLTGIPVTSVEHAESAAKKLQEMG